MIPLKPLLPLLCILLFSCGEQRNTDDKSESTATIRSAQTPAPKKDLDVTQFKANLATQLNKAVLSMLEDGNGNYWFGTLSSGVFWYKGSTLLRFTEKDGLPQNQVEDIQEDEAGNIWFSTGGYGISYFDGQKMHTPSKQDATRLHNGVAKVWETTATDLWFSAVDGAYRYHDTSLSHLPLPTRDNE